MIMRNLITLIHQLSRRGQTVLIGLLVLSTATCSAQETVVVTGEVSQVLSGDRFILAHPQLGQLNVQLQGVSAPVLAFTDCQSQPWAEQAKRYLNQQIYKRTVSGSCLKQLDDTGFAHCRIQRDGQEINLAVIASGYAWFDRRLGNDLPLQQAEQTAKNDKIGLWSDRLPIIAPWKYRTQCSKH